MRKYFAYPFNEEVKTRLLTFYNEQDSHHAAEAMHGENHVRKTKLKMERMKDNLTLTGEDEALDVGCSNGALCELLAPNCRHVTGIDISEGLIQGNTEREKADNITYRSYDGVNIGQLEAYDEIFMMDVLEHAFEPDALMRSVYAALKPGGVLFMQVPTTGWLSECVCGKYHLGHLRYYDDVYLKSYLPTFGYTVKSIKVYNSVPIASRALKHPRLYRMLDKLCGAIPPRLYPYFGSVMAVCEKPQ